MAFLVVTEFQGSPPQAGNPWPHGQEHGQEHGKANKQSIHRYPFGKSVYQPFKYLQ
jgi:hypothetical protein